jgi:hypothetical protein
MYQDQRANAYVQKQLVYLSFSVLPVFVPHPLEDVALFSVQAPTNPLLVRVRVLKTSKKCLKVTF